MTRADELKLLARERRAALEQALLNRAVRNHKGPVDRAITRIVMTQIPDVPDDQAGGAPGQRGRLDAPPACSGAGAEDPADAQRPRQGPRVGS